ncbi:MAG: tripartite tricarboxylate transporter TctB family protein [Rhodobacteraceae bacterium]|nr:tripartite tricarboxylate transporter TctB family protein [Paracoccaceae bacterium]
MNADRVLGAGFVVLGLGMVWSMMRLRQPILGEGDPGAAVLPMTLGVVLAVIGAVLVLRRPAPARAAAQAAGALSETAEIQPPEPPLLAALHLANLLVYAMLFERAGFSLSSFLFLSVAIALFGEKTPRGVLVAVVAAAIFTVVVGTTLALLIGVPLPGVLLG